MNKTELLASIQREHERLKEAINGLSDEQMVRSGIYADNDWTAKDILTHVAAWEQLQVGWMRAKREGRVLNPPTAAMWQGTAALNEQFYARYKDYTIAQAWAEFERSFQEIVAEVEALSDEALADPSPYDPTTEQPLYIHIVVNTYEHYPEHTTALIAWREREGF